MKYSKVNRVKNALYRRYYQSPLILTELFQHNRNKRFLSHGMLPLSGHDDVALLNDVAHDAESTQKSKLRHYR